MIMAADVEPAWEVLPAEDLVGLINDGHESVMRTMKASIMGAIQVGYWLYTLKDRKRRESMDADGHSSFRWLEFIADHLTFGHDQASNYMLLYRYREKISTSGRNFSGMHSALEFLAEERRKERREGREQARREAQASPNGDDGKAGESDGEATATPPGKARKSAPMWDQLLANTGAISAAIKRHGLDSILRRWSVGQLENGIAQARNIGAIMKTIEDAFRRKLDEGH